MKYRLQLVMIEDTSRALEDLAPHVESMQDVQDDLTEREALSFLVRYAKDRAAMIAAGVAGWSAPEGVEVVAIGDLADGRVTL